MKRIKIPSLAPIRLGDFDHRITPAVICVLLMPQRLRESFSFLATLQASFYSLIPGLTGLPGYHHYLIKDICARRQVMFNLKPNQH